MCEAEGRMFSCRAMMNMLYPVQVRAGHRCRYFRCSRDGASVGSSLWEALWPLAFLICRCARQHTRGTPASTGRAATFFFLMKHEQGGPDGPLCFGCDVSMSGLIAPYS